MTGKPHMNGKDWLNKNVRVYSGPDWAKQHEPMAEGRVVAYIEGPSIIVRDAQGRDTAWPTSLPIDVEHVHRWLDVSRMADATRHEACTLPGCDAKREVER